ncbi:IS6 family transposase [Acidisoma cellulosilytica]|uniref:IS6 family transposase n=1 Tax=Acidisoma cellulosilyticum TaxID=2802395 RepID=A0A963Z4H4_9PROT|nr:IS6 family transposase [Acidisoma cellulosilyticum]
MNNLIEQDPRGIKARTGPMLGFKHFKTASITHAGIELIRRIYNGQFNVENLRIEGTAMPATWNAVPEA